MLISDAEAAAEGEDGVVILQGEVTEELFQFSNSFADFRWITFVGFCVGLVKLIQDGFAIAIAGVKGMGGYVGIQPLYNILHISTPLCQ